ncbi:ATP-binding protein [Streptomyces sp. NPDC006367]|uniref:ATP-binding protein n=1 Tax=unclassified Streptomyces TaxID=2593676 RepID=UPI0033B22184
MLVDGSTASTPGFYLQVRQAGFAVHMNASAAHLRSLRALADKTLCAAGLGGGISDAAQLIASELIGNAVRACGDHAPLVVEIDAEESGVTVKVHDPMGDRLPSRRPIALDDEKAEDGRGLGLVDILAPGWTVRPTPVGKQVVCRLPYPEGDLRG